VGSKQIIKGAVTPAKLSKAAKATLSGPRGPKGETGAPGPKGETGAKGDTGLTGAAGPEARRLDFIGNYTDSAPVSGDPGAHQVLTLGALTVRASCVDAGAGNAQVYVTAHSSVDAQIWWQVIRFQNPETTQEVSGGSLGPDGSPNVAFVNLKGNNRFESGQLIFRSPAETITVSFEGDAESNAAEECQFLGTAVRATS
jgi:hypothetical protein